MSLTWSFATAATLLLCTTSVFRATGRIRLSLLSICDIAITNSAYVASEERKRGANDGSEERSDEDLSLGARSERRKRGATTRSERRKRGAKRRGSYLVAPLLVLRSPLVAQSAMRIIVSSLRSSFVAPLLMRLVSSLRSSFFARRTVYLSYC